MDSVWSHYWAGFRSLLHNGDCGLYVRAKICNSESGGESYFIHSEDRAVDKWYRKDMVSGRRVRSAMIHILQELHRAPVWALFTLSEPRNSKVLTPNRRVRLGENSRRKRMIKAPLTKKCANVKVIPNL